MTGADLPPALVGLFDQVADLLLPPPDDRCTDRDIRSAELELRASGAVGRAAARHPELVRRYAAWMRAAREDESSALDRAVAELRGLRHALDEISAQIRLFAAERTVEP